MSDTPHPLDRLLAALTAAEDMDWQAATYAEGIPAKGLLHVTKPLMVKMADDPWSMYDRWRCDEGYFPVLLEASLFGRDDAAMLARFYRAVGAAVREIRAEEADGPRLGLFGMAIPKFDSW